MAGKASFFPYEVLLGHLPAVENMACRVFHGRGDFYPDWKFLNIDYFSGYLLVVLYEERSEHWCFDFSTQLHSLCGNSLPIKKVLFQFRCRAGSPVFDSSNALFSEQVDIIESELLYRIQIGGRQNTGFFTDMAAGHQWVSEHAANKRVLNLFSYTCAFSVAAIAGGAEHVVNMDMNSSVLAQGRDNHRLNRLNLSAVSFQKVDIMKSWGRIRKHGPYDLVIIDPPTFQKGSFIALRDYPKLIKRAAEWCKPGADLLFCLNQPDTSASVFKEWISTHSDQFNFISRIENPSVMKESNPDNGLKVLHYQLA